jgi:hypothetical protein
MRKVLIVGLGGSGGKTLSFIMDELKVILKDAGWEKDSLPECWKFVHIDVPTTAGGTGKGLADSVEALGGKYVGLASLSQYPPYDDVAFDRFSKSEAGLRGFARWRPVPEDAADIDILGGAGAYRAIGRVVTLTKSEGIHATLDNVATELNLPQAGYDLEFLHKALSGPAPGKNDKPLVLIVSSMAGGSGASMVLDVADILRGIQPETLGSENSAAFLYTADVFKSLPEVYDSAASGTLATLAELTNALGGSDRKMSEKYWHSIVPSKIPLPSTVAFGRGPKLVFPIGSQAHGVPFGSTPQDVYRGFAKMLSPLFYNGIAQNAFHEYAITNWPKQIKEKATDPLNLFTKLISDTGAGGQEKIRPMLFGTWGSSTLTMGRDRYKEYAAQRIGREIAEILTEGFRFPTEESMSLDDQVAKRAEQLYPRFIAMVDLGGDGSEDWRGTGKLANSLAKQVPGAQEWISATSKAGVDDGKIKAKQAVLKFLNDKLSSEAADRKKKTLDMANKALTDWLQGFIQRLDNAVLFSLSQGGIDATKQVLKSFESDLSETRRQMLPLVNQLADGVQKTLKDTLDRERGSKDQASSNFISSLKSNFDGFLNAKLSQSVAEVAVEVLGDIARTVIPSIIRALDISKNELIAQLADSKEVPTSAAYRDAPIATWPRGSAIPTHFNPTVNEVVLTDLSQYDVAFNSQVDTESNRKGLRDIASLILFRKVLLDNGLSQPKTGLSSEPGAWHPSLVTNSSSWKPPRLSNGSSSELNYTFKFNAQSIRDLSFEYLSVPGSAFDLYSRISIGDWLKENPSHNAVFTTKLQTAISYASPLVGIDSSAVRIFHGDGYQATYYKFTSIPISKTSAPITSISGSWGASDTAVINSTELKEACDEASPTKEIVITSKAPPYAPWVFGSITTPIKENLAGYSGGEESPVWSNVRARQLREFVPLGVDLLQVFLQGWLIGRITGLIQWQSATENNPFTISVHPIDGDPVKVSKFGHTTLGVKKLGMTSTNSGRDSTGWNIPAVLLETLPLALANASSRPDVLRPYLDVLELGRDLKSSAIATESHILNALDLWFSGSRNIPDSQISVANLESKSEAREAIRQWLVQIDAYLESVEDTKLTSDNFFSVNPVYEIASEMREAVKSVQKELDRPDLGQTPDGFRPSRKPGSDGQDDIVIPEA